MRIYLVQHAEALTDAVDPRKTARELAAGCARRRLEAAEILHSGKLRALQTAQILAEALGLPVRETSGLDPLDPVRPFLERLAASMLAGREDPPVLVFQRGGMACLEPLDGSWRLLWTAFPD